MVALFNFAQTLHNLQMTDMEIALVRCICLTYTGRVKEFRSIFISLRNVFYNLFFSICLFFKRRCTFIVDRCELKNPEKVEEIQWKMLMCLQYVVEKNHNNSERYFSRIMDRLAAVRNLTDWSNKIAQEVKLDWPILQRHPLLLEMMSMWWC